MRMILDIERLDEALQNEGVLRLGLSNCAMLMNVAKMENFFKNFLDYMDNKTNNENVKELEKEFEEVRDKSILLALETINEDV